MSDGKTHHKAWKLVGTGFIPLSIMYSFFDPITGIGLFLGYLLGTFVEPDLDHPNMTYSEYKAKKIFGVFGAMWVGYWMVYAHIFPHRSFWSHFPGISTVIRMIYGLWWFYVGLWIIYIQYGWWDNMVLWITFGVWVGLTVSDTIHWFMDYIWSRYVK